MKALVTGATGFVGSHLVDALTRAGHAVTALVRNPAKAAALHWPGVTLARGDLHSPAALEAASAGQDVIFHVAGAVAARSEAEYIELLKKHAYEEVEAARIPDDTPTPEVYSGKWFRNADELRDFKRIGALLLTARKPDLRSMAPAHQIY